MALSKKSMETRHPCRVDRLDLVGCYVGLPGQPSGLVRFGPSRLPLASFPCGWPSSSSLFCVHQGFLTVLVFVPPVAYHLDDFAGSSGGVSSFLSAPPMLRSPNPTHGRQSGMLFDCSYACFVLPVLHRSKKGCGDVSATKCFVASLLQLKNQIANALVRILTCLDMFPCEKPMSEVFRLSSLCLRSSNTSSPTLPGIIATKACLSHSRLWPPLLAKPSTSHTLTVTKVGMKTMASSLRATSPNAEGFKLRFGLRV